MFEATSIRAISFDGDQTLWDFRAAMRRALAEAARFLDERGLRREGGPVSADWLAELRDEVAGEPRFARSTMEEIRLASFERAVLRCDGHDGDDGGRSLVTDVYEAYMSLRFSAMKPYDEVPAVLDRLRGSHPLVLVTNGNSDPARVGLGDHFTHQVVAAECGLFKPDPEIYAHTAALLGLPPESILHVGDHPDEDVAAAGRAGMRTVYLNRAGRPLPPGRRADAEMSTLAGLLDLLPQRD
ncbi:HAD family hydrolase [Nocardiopsis sp. Huas11]|uniref:HAD family hydrolase n=1 Tax=Nocardiopsis sp. Huas11 TaxID=2183912 RepID=UPI001315760C|nr:HAD family hydrolase [Nocardiopsis sp. Huas11]